VIDACLHTDILDGSLAVRLAQKAPVEGLQYLFAPLLAYGFPSQGFFLFSGRPKRTIAARRAPSAGLAHNFVLSYQIAHLPGNKTSPAYRDHRP
jgi:hypothetical protein